MIHSGWQPFWSWLKRLFELQDWLKLDLGNFQRPVKAFLQTTWANPEAQISLFPSKDKVGHFAKGFASPPRQLCQRIASLESRVWSSRLIPGVTLVCSNSEDDSGTLFVLNWLSWQIVSDDKIQITILILRRYLVYTQWHHLIPPDVHEQEESSMVSCYMMNIQWIKTRKNEEQLTAITDSQSHQR